MSEPDRPLNEQELKALQQNLARLSEPSVKEVYRQAWEECRMKGERLPPAKAVQQLVQALETAVEAAAIVCATAYCEHSAYVRTAREKIRT